MDGLISEMNRVREIIQIYAETPAGFLAAAAMQQSIKAAEQSIRSGDVIEMLKSYHALTEWEL